MADCVKYVKKTILITMKHIKGLRTISGCKKYFYNNFCEL